MSWGRGGEEAWLYAFSMKRDLYPNELKHNVIRDSNQEYVTCNISMWS